MPTFSRLRRLLLLACTTLFSSNLLAQTYPARSVRIIVPTAPGGGSDTQARLLSQLYDLNVEIEACTQMLVESQENGEPGWGEYGASDNTLRLVSNDSIRLQPEPYTTIEDANKLRQWFLNLRLRILRLGCMLRVILFRWSCRRGD